MKDAHDILTEASNTIAERGQSYDSEKERSMKATVAAFNGVTGHTLTEQQGWLFMLLLKCVRLNGRLGHKDSVVDATAYAALMGESTLEKVL